MAGARPNGATPAARPADVVIMKPAGALTEIVDRLAAEFGSLPRRAIDQVVSEGWALFRGSADDEVLRVVATEWWARNELELRIRLRSDHAVG